MAAPDPDCRSCSDAGYTLAVVSGFPPIPDGWLWVRPCLACSICPDPADAAGRAAAVLNRATLCLYDRFDLVGRWAIAPTSDPLPVPATVTISEAPLPLAAMSDGFEFGGCTFTVTRTDPDLVDDPAPTVEWILGAIATAQRALHPSARRWITDDHTWIGVTRPLIAAILTHRDRYLVNPLASAPLHPDRDTDILPTDPATARAWLAVLLSMYTPLAMHAFPNFDVWTSAVLRAIDDLEQNGGAPW